MAWPDGGTNEVTKTIGATGRNHSTIAAWEADTNYNCVTGWGAGDYSSPCSPVGDCYDDADFNEEVFISGATTDSTHYRRLTAHVGERHNGTSGAGVWLVTVHPRDKYVVAEWLIIEERVTCSSQPNDARFVLRFCVYETSDAYDIAIHEDSAGTGVENYMENCVLILPATGHAVYDSPIIVRNCSALGGNVVFKGCDCTNVISVGGTTNFSGCTGDYNIGSDATAPGENSIDNVDEDDIYTNTGSGTEDLHLKSDATDASGAGDDLSASFTIDIDGQTRVDWDIGADEFISGAPTGIPAHSDYYFRMRGQ